MKKLLSILLVLVLCLFAFACRASPDSGDNTGKPSDGTGTPPAEDAPDDTDFAQKVEYTRLNTVATDALGRFYDGAEKFDEDKQVGLFYFLWSGSGAANRDISKSTLDDIKSAAHVGEFHYWSEPLYGYYHSGDPWVFRKHLELFAALGIDYLMFDATNSYIYEEVLDSILPVALELHDKGYVVPKLAFYCNTNTKNTVTKLYNGYYKPGTENGDKYADLWYRWKDTNNANAAGKPWIAARTNGDAEKDFGGPTQDFSKCGSEICDFFYVKDAQWPNAKNHLDNGMPWMSWEESGVQRSYNGIMSVSVAQHTSGAFSDAVLENNRKLGRGRGYDYNSKTNNENAVNMGTNYEAQWQNAITDSSVNNVFITGFNEWIAQKQPTGMGRSSSYFVDLYNAEFSRDVEMMKGGYGDNFLLQTARNIRAFKAVGTPAEFTERKIVKGGDVSQWNATACYVDCAGDTTPRDYKSANTTLKNYTVNTGRNDITSVRVTHDGDYIYFRIECANKITAYTAGDKCWLNLFIEVDGEKGSNWNGYQFVVNRNIADETTFVERLSADGSSDPFAAAEIWKQSKAITVKIARSDIAATGASVIRFKAADNVTDYTDITDYYVNGDSAPLGRLSYSYRIK